MTTTTEATFCTVPEGDETTGAEAVDLARAYGVPLDDWQATIVRGILRESPHGGWSASQAGLVVARQNGKGQILLALELAGLLLLSEQVLHTAHAVKTSSDAFRRLWRLIEGHSDLTRLVKRHSQQVGLEYVELVSGARVAFTTRSASAGRGLSIDRLVVDEAEDLPGPEVGALAPTVFSRPKAQSIYVGTAPGPMHDAEAFATMRKSAHEGLNPRLAWWEWCAEYGANIDDHELWTRVNPAVATGRVARQAITDDRAILPPDQFRAERLSMWIPAGAAATVFDAPAWEALQEPDSAPVTAISVGIDVPPSRDSATVCVAGLRVDGFAHLEWYITDPGIAWVAPWVGERLTNEARAVVVDSKNPAADLPWRAHGVRPLLLDARGAAHAAGQVYDAVSSGSLRHRGQVELSRGVLGARQRPMLNGAQWAWDRKAPGSSVLIAASLALYGVTAERSKRPRVSGESARAGRGN